MTSATVYLSHDDELCQAFAVGQLNGEQTHDRRLAFQRPATIPVQLATELHRLARCPAVTIGFQVGPDRSR